MRRSTVQGRMSLRLVGGRLLVAASVAVGYAGVRLARAGAAQPTVRAVELPAVRTIDFPAKEAGWRSLEIFDRIHETMHIAILFDGSGTYRTHRYIAGREWAISEAELHAWLQNTLWAGE